MRATYARNSNAQTTHVPAETAPGSPGHHG
jgi:hypothetical protein